MESLTNKPTGHLLLSITEKRKRFYEKQADGTRRYIPKKEQETVVALAQNDYNEKILKLCKYQLHTIQAFLTKFNPNCFDEYYENLHPMRKTLVKPLFTPQDEFIKKWLNRPYPYSNTHEMLTTYTTDNGENVRSKSEVIIANKLASKGIPYLYEFPMKLGESMCFPDFTILNPVTKKVMIWEHFGMMDDPNYNTRALKKLNLYQRCGYIQGVNLIVTFESTQVPLDLTSLDKMLSTYY